MADGNVDGEYKIELRALTFTPPTMSIKVGDTIKFTGENGSETWSGHHNVNGKKTVSGQEGNPAELYSGSAVMNGSFEHTFTVAGQYKIQCDPHADQGMKATIIVTES